MSAAIVTFYSQQEALNTFLVIVRVCVITAEDKETYF